MIPPPPIRMIDKAWKIISYLFFAILSTLIVSWSIIVFLLKIGILPEPNGWDGILVLRGVGISIISLTFSFYFIFSRSKLSSKMKWVISIITALLLPTIIIAINYLLIEVISN